MDEDAIDGVSSIDGEAALAATRDAVGDDHVLICTVFDTHGFLPIYVDDRIDALYPDADVRAEHFGSVHDYVYLDFTERDLFEDLFIDPGGVDAFATFMGALVVVRVLAGESGVFVALTPETPVTPVVQALREAIGE